MRLSKKGWGPELTVSQMSPQLLWFGNWTFFYPKKIMERWTRCLIKPRKAKMNQTEYLCFLLSYTWVFPKIGYHPIIRFNRVSITKHPFWGTPYCWNTHMSQLAVCAMALILFPIGIYEGRELEERFFFSTNSCHDFELLKTEFEGSFTLPGTKIAIENQWLEDNFPFGMTYFQRPCWF